MHESRLRRKRRNLELAARLVECHGDDYLWVFERMEEEVTRLEKMLSTRSRAIELAKKFRNANKEC